MREIARGLLKAIGRVEKAFEELRNTWNGESYVVRESYMVNLGRDLQVVNRLECAFRLFESHVRNINALRYRHNHWVVDVSQSFDPQQLPGQFGHRLVSYTSRDVQTQYSHQRIHTPNNSQFDQTDYPAFGLSPGVKVVGLSMRRVVGCSLKTQMVGEG